MKSLAKQPTQTTTATVVTAAAASSNDAKENNTIQTELSSAREELNALYLQIQSRQTMLDALGSPGEGDNGESIQKKIDELVNQVHEREQQILMNNEWMRSLEKDNEIQKREIQRMTENNNSQLKKIEVLTQHNAEITTKLESTRAQLEVQLDRNHIQDQLNLDLKTQLDSQKDHVSQLEKIIEDLRRQLQEKPQSVIVETVKVVQQKIDQTKMDDNVSGDNENMNEQNQQHEQVQIEETEEQVKFHKIPIDELDHKSSVQFQPELVSSEQQQIQTKSIDQTDEQPNASVDIPIHHSNSEQITQLEEMKKQAALEQLELQRQIGELEKEIALQEQTLGLEREMRSSIEEKLNSKELQTTAMLAEVVSLKERHSIQIAVLEKESANLAKQITEAKKQLNAATKEHESKIERLKDHYERKNKVTIESEKRQKDALQADLRRERERVEELEVRGSEIEAEITQLKADVAALERMKIQQTGAITGYRKTILEVKEELNAKSSELESTKYQIEVQTTDNAELTSQVEQRDSKLEQMMVKLRQLTESLNSKNREITELKKLLTSLGDQNTKLELNLRNTKKKAASFAQKIVPDLKQQVEDKENQLKMVKGALVSSQTSLRTKDTEISRLKQKIITVESQSALASAAAAAAAASISTSTLQSNMNISTLDQQSTLPSPVQAYPRLQQPQQNLNQNETLAIARQRKERLKEYQNRILANRNKQQQQQQQQPSSQQSQSNSLGLPIGSALKSEGAIPISNPMISQSANNPFNNNNNYNNRMQGNFFASNNNSIHNLNNQKLKEQSQRSLDTVHSQPPLYENYNNNNSSSKSAIMIPNMQSRWISVPSTNHSYHNNQKDLSNSPLIKRKNANGVFDVAASLPSEDIKSGLPFSAGVFNLSPMSVKVKSTSLRTIPSTTTTASKVTSSANKPKLRQLPNIFQSQNGIISGTATAGTTTTTTTTTPNKVGTQKEESSLNNKNASMNDETRDSKSDSLGVKHEQNLLQANDNRNEGDSLKGNENQSFSNL